MVSAIAVCGSSPLSRTPAVAQVIAPTLTSSPSRVATGRALYLKHCARCHGEKGEGIEAPALIDETTNMLQSFPNAAILFRYVRFLMPMDAPDSLSEEDYWAVLAYLLFRNGFIEENFPLGPETAERVRLKR